MIFLNIEAGKRLSAQIAQALSGLPYEKAKWYVRKEFTLRQMWLKIIFFKPGMPSEKGKQPKTDLDRWLTERYCWYLLKNNHCYRYDIHHLEWEIKELNRTDPKVNYQIGDLLLTEQPDICHYSEGVNVLASPGKR